MLSISAIVCTRGKRLRFRTLRYESSFQTLKTKQYLKFRLKLPQSDNGRNLTNSSFPKPIYGLEVPEPSVPSISFQSYCHQYISSWQQKYPQFLREISCLQQRTTLVKEVSG